MNETRKYKKAVAALEAYLTKGFEVAEPQSVTVFASTFRGDGFRIDEISIADEGGGCSYQRCIMNLVTQSLLIACEDFVRKFGIKPWRPKGWDSDIDEFAEATEKLDWIIKEMTKKEEAA